MIRPIVTSELILRLPSEPATAADAQVGQDLLDTLAAHTDECVGMAANMIGVRKRVIVPGQRPTTRWRSITVSYLDTDFHPHKRLFRDYVAQIIQHEIDHCDGIVI